MPSQPVSQLGRSVGRWIEHKAPRLLFYFFIRRAAACRYRGTRERDFQDECAELM